MAGPGMEADLIFGRQLKIDKGTSTSQPRTPGHIFDFADFIKLHKPGIRRQSNRRAPSVLRGYYCRPNGTGKDAIHDRPNSLRSRLYGCTLAVWS